MRTTFDDDLPHLRLDWRTSSVWVKHGRIRRGGCGEVWKAEAPGGIPKAIKFVTGDLDGFEPGAAEQEHRSLHRVNRPFNAPTCSSIARTGRIGA